MTRRDTERGFTLIEVLVSLAIFSLAIVGLNRAATLAVSGASSLQLKTHAGIVADNAVVLTRIQPIELGINRTEDSSGGIDFDVVTETAETEAIGFYEITVRVSQSETDRIISERRAFRYAQQTTVTTSEGGGG